MSNLDSLNYGRCHIWQFIIGHKYVNVGSRGFTYGMVLRHLEDVLGEDFKKPVVLLDVAQMYEEEYQVAVDLELIDHEFGV